MTPRHKLMKVMWKQIPLYGGLGILARLLFDHSEETILIYTQFLVHYIMICGLITLELYVNDNIYGP